MDDNQHDPPESGGSSFFQNFQHTPIGARVPEKIGRGVFTTGLMILQTNELFVLDFLSMGAPPPQIVSRIIMVVSHYAQFVAALRSNIEHYESQFGPIRSHEPAGHVAEMPPTSPDDDFHGGDDPHGGHFSHEFGHSSEPHYDPPSHGDSSGHGGSAGQGHPYESVEYGVPGSASPPRSQPPPEAVTDLYAQVKFPEELMPGAFSDAVMIRHSPEEFCFDFICSLYPKPIVVSRIYFAAGRARGLLGTLSGALERFKRFGPPPPEPPQEPPPYE